jgi:signal transduction histidine kinase/DNA-binding response OmpR family regulator
VSTGASASGGEGAEAAAPLAADVDEKVNILVVDDLPEKLLVFETVLEELNQNVVAVRSGREALRQVLQREFAVILLDVNMPDMDGFETAALIRQHKRSAHTPIIFITAYADEMQTERGYALGAVDYILAPVVAGVLRGKVQVFVQLFSMQRQIRRQADAHTAFVAAEAARRAAEDNDRRSAFLSEASKVLNRSLQVDAGLRDLLGLIVPAWASFAAVLRADAEPSTEVLTARRTAGGDGMRFKSQALGTLSPAIASALDAALRDKRRIGLEPSSRGELQNWLSSGGARAGPAPPVDAAAAVPLLNGERVVGVLFVVSCAGDALDAAIGWSVIDDLAARSAAALENARLYGSLQAEIVERRAIESQLIEAGRRKDEFLAMLSHELRNPLAPIRTALEVVRRIGSPDPKFAWATDIMMRQVRQMTRLIEELLDVARISQGKIVLTREKVDLNAVISASVETVQPAVDARNQVLEVTPLAQPISVEGDAARLSQILSNLLSNAAKFSDKATTIELRARVDTGTVAISVRDHGIGIEADLLPRVFDLFTQGQRALDRSQGGLGIGLTLARRLAEMHGGTLDAASRGAGKGSEFTLRLPCSVSTGDGAATKPPQPTRCSKRLRILVVDDNDDAAQSIVTFLQIDGHDVRSAGDGAQALEVAADFAPEVVVLDIGLPFLDGYEVARRLRQAPLTRHTLLLALTGYGQKHDRQQAQAAGFDAHFVKPVDPAKLLACIDDWASQTTASG